MKIKGYKTESAARAALTRTDAHSACDIRDPAVEEGPAGWYIIDRQGYIIVPGRRLDPKDAVSVLSAN